MFQFCFNKDLDNVSVPKFNVIFCICHYNISIVISRYLCAFTCYTRVATKEKCSSRQRLDWNSSASYGQQSYWNYSIWVPASQYQSIVIQIWTLSHHSYCGDSKLSHFELILAYCTSYSVGYNLEDTSYSQQFCALVDWHHKCYWNQVTSMLVINSSGCHALTICCWRRQFTITALHTSTSLGQ